MALVAACFVFAAPSCAAAHPVLRYIWLVLHGLPDGFSNYLAQQTQAMLPCFSVNQCFLMVRVGWPLLRLSNSQWHFAENSYLSYLSSSFKSLFPFQLSLCRNDNKQSDSSNNEQSGPTTTSLLWFLDVCGEWTYESCSLSSTLPNLSG